MPCLGRRPWWSFHLISWDATTLGHEDREHCTLRACLQTCLCSSFSHGRSTSAMRLRSYVFLSQRRDEPEMEISYLITSQGWKFRTASLEPSSFQGLPWEPSSSKRGSRKFWARKFSRSMGATQRLQNDAGGQKSCKDLGFTAFLGNLASGTFRQRNFSIPKFLRSIGATQRSQDNARGQEP